MKRFILIGLFVLPLPCPVASHAADNTTTPRRLLTAVDLLKMKDLPTFSPPCNVGTSASGLITAEDLLRNKGLLEGPVNGEKNTQEEDDIWGMGQDFGC